MPKTYISPWTQAEAQRRRAMTAGRDTWKQPEAPPMPKPRQYFVLGMEVDYNTYREYNYEKTWTLDGDVVKGFSVTLWALEHYATEEHAKDRPIEAANARKILDQIRAEIEVINRKEDENMKDPRTAADFIAALQDIYNESRATYDSLNVNVEKARAKMERARQETQDPSKNTQIAQAKYSIAKGEFQIAEDEARNGYRKMEEGHNAKVKELREQFAAYLADHYSATPDQLDGATMQLLNSGICTPYDLSKLIDRHKDNPTMLRIVGNYARNMREEKKKTLTREEWNICASVAAAAHAAKDGSRELALFDSAVSSAAYGLGKDYGHATRMHSHVTGWLDDFKNRITNLPLTPAEQSTPEQD